MITTCSRLVNNWEQLSSANTSSRQVVRFLRVYISVFIQNELEELLTTINEDTATSLAKEELLNNNVRDLFTEVSV